MDPKKKARSQRRKSAKAKPKPKAKKPVKKASRKPAPRLARPDLATPYEALPMIKGRGSRAAGQSGDIEGLSDAESVDSESVEELVEEGQDFEAEVVDSVANAPDPDEAELDAEVPPENDQGADGRSFAKRNRL
jgi:hypothetical protein